MKTNEERLQDILAQLDTISYIHSDSIPQIDLYMDQVTSLMDERLKKTKRHPEDKALTKTMINNYAKNRLLPPPIRKKYSRDHILLLFFIYYYKSLLSFNDIEQLLKPLIDHYFPEGSTLSIEEIYEQVFALEDEQMSHLKEDVRQKFRAAKQTFSDEEIPERDYLQLFAFISELSFDVYLKKQMIEGLIDGLRAEDTQAGNSRKKNKG